MFIADRYLLKPQDSKGSHVYYKEVLNRKKIDYWAIKCTQGNSYGENSQQHFNYLSQNLSNW